MSTVVDIGSLCGSCCVLYRFPRTVLRKGNIKKQGKTGIYSERFAVSHSCM